jgi:hypothetical protein
MKIEQSYWTAAEGWRDVPSTALGGKASLLLLFGARGVLADAARRAELQARYPDAPLVGCSTSGEICDTRVRDGSLVATAIRFEHTRVELASTTLDAAGDSSYAAGTQLAMSLPTEELVHVLVFSDGLRVNGSELARGLRESLSTEVAVTGGLAGDGADFAHTLLCDANGCGEGRIVAIGLYGERLKVGYGSLGGWDTFGAERLITRSRGNVLYELDGQSALALYKKYLGEFYAGPAEALLFPLALKTPDAGFELVRTVLSVNEEEQSMTFAGDMPQGSYVRLMKANFDRLVDGAAGAARGSLETLGRQQPQFALLISCVGRKLVLKQRVEEEVEEVREVLGKGAVLAGFYSYGEICPHGAITQCELHNQTMTITTFAES